MIFRHHIIHVLLNCFSQTVQQGLKEYLLVAARGEADIETGNRLKNHRRSSPSFPSHLSNSIESTTRPGDTISLMESEDGDDIDEDDDQNVYAADEALDAMLGIENHLKNELGHRNALLHALENTNASNLVFRQFSQDRTSSHERSWKDSYAGQNISASSFQKMDPSPPNVSPAFVDEFDVSRTSKSFDGFHSVSHGNGRSSNMEKSTALPDDYNVDSFALSQRKEESDSARGVESSMRLVGMVLEMTKIKQDLESQLLELRLKFFNIFFASVASIMQVHISIFIIMYFSDKIEREIEGK